ncbi:MAG TPA: TonB-dependent receptor [Methylovirgula sp.]|nr:TonB-dependent receptor [Methylovirgula sp.]
MRFKVGYARSALVASVSLSVFTLPSFAQEALPTVEVVATSPVGTQSTSTLNVPSEVQTIDSKEIENLNHATITEDLARRTPGVATTDELGSPLNQSIEFRGQTATPVPGTPEGLAVYQNGVRINEAYGDVVNWALIPPIAIQQTQIVTGNPVFGLNALAGAVVMNMKNGFTWQGAEFGTQFGTDFRHEAYAEYGMTKGDWAYYAAVEGLGDNGFRDGGASGLGRAYGDIGYRVEGNEVHVNVTAGRASFGTSGTAPIDLVQQDPRAYFNLPGLSQESMGMITLSDQSKITSTLQFNGNVYFRDYAAFREDGNISDFYHCAAAFFCNGGALTTLPDPTTGLPNGQPAGEIDSNWTHSYSTGTTLQLTDTDKIFGHNNNLIAGVSLDHGWTHFGGMSTIGDMPPDRIVSSYGIVIDQPAYDISPVALLSQNNYLGVYVLDSFDVTDRLTVNAGARFNDAQIDLNDINGTSLTSSNNFNRINPTVGASFKITPDVAAYVNYSEANRAPTPLELGCASPTQPCQIDNFLVADPPLKQVVARTVEGGFKGDHHITGGPIPGELTWSVSLYRTENQDDIMNVPSTITGFGYFVNAGNTLRQGVDLGATYTTANWDVYANYSYIQATFLTPVQLASPNNPNANCLGPGSGIECVTPGDNLPGIPRHKFKIGFDYTVLPKWTVGADLVYESSRYYFGDEINSLPQVPGFATLNLRTAYQFSKTVQIYGMINNALDYRYATYGALYDTGSSLNQVTGAPVPGLFNSTDPRAITLAPPFEAYIGLRVTL